jgi:hypothetical protein
MATMVSVLTFSPTKKMFQIGPVVPKKDPKAQSVGILHKENFIRNKEKNH